jgi:hypothetical protein
LNVARADFHRKQGDPLALSTYQVQTGPSTGAYLRIASNRHWTDFDAEAARAKADEADGRSEAEALDATFSHAVSGLRTEIIQYRADLSYVPAKK